jgi:hypothetical protein
MVQKIMNMRFIIYKVGFGDVTHLYTKKKYNFRISVEGLTEKKMIPQP